MNKNIEKEYKILVSEDQFYTLLKEYPQAVFKEQINTYYDTEDFMIRKAHGAMRIRYIDNIYIFTLKMHSPEGLLEFEKEVAQNDVAMFEIPEIKELLESYQLRGPFHRITELKTQRAMIETGLAELCFDISDYNGIRDFEIEYEYKKAHDGRTIFNDILSKVGLTYIENCSSKIKRAMKSIQ